MLAHYEDSAAEAVHQIRKAYPGMTVSEILWHDWDWIEETLGKIARDQMHERLFSLESHIAAVMAEHGQVEKYEALRNTCLTEEDRIAIEEAEMRRVRKARDKSQVRRRVVKVPDTESNDGAG